MAQQPRERWLSVADIPSDGTLVEAAFSAAIDAASSLELVTEAARCRRWCPQVQVPKPLLLETLIAITLRRTTALLVLGKLLA